MTHKRARRWWRGSASSRGQARGKRVDDGGSQGYPLGKRVDSLLELGVFLNEALELGDGVQHGGVILTTEGAPDVAERGVGELTREVHGNLAREGHGLGAILGAHVGELDAEELGRLALDVLDGDDPLFLA